MTKRNFVILMVFGFVSMLIMLESCKKDDDIIDLGRTALDHAYECEEVLGPLPRFSCADGVEDGLKYVIEQGWVNPEKVAIYGGSHGGYAVLRGLTKTPDLYTCGIDYVGVSNLFSFMETIPPYWKPYLKMIKAIWYDLDVEEENVIMKEVSPVFHIDKIKKPLFVVQGANDPRVNIDESDQIVEGLRANGVSVPYMVKYDEGHGFGKEENRMDFYKAMMGFLAENLK